jgi:hypothetical protein
VTAVSADTRDLKKLKIALSVLDKQSKRAVGKALSGAVEPVRDEFKAQAGALPSRGGLSRYVAKSRFAVVKRLGGSRPTLSIRVRRTKRGGTVDLTKINEGRLRHPVHGDPRRTRKQWRWVNQSIKAGMWDNTLERAVPGIEDGLRDAVREVVQATIRAGN